MQDDLSAPLYEEDLDGSAGVLFPFYDPDTQMLYLAGKVMNQEKLRTFWGRESFLWWVCVVQGDGNIRYYELSSEKPYISFLREFRSLLPHKGLGETHLWFWRSFLLVLKTSNDYGVKVTG